MVEWWGGPNWTGSGLLQALLSVQLVSWVLPRVQAAYAPSCTMSQAIRLLGCAGKIQVMEALLKAVRAIEPTDKVVIVSNYTESLDLLQQVGGGWAHSVPAL
jgi:hypothetical protein